MAGTTSEVDRSGRWIEETFHPHWRVGLRACELLHEVETDHQHLVIFKNETWGTVLVLDGVIQLTTRDEFIYHEMMVHVPLMALNRPESILVIGGGDGGVLREVLKHSCVHSVLLCEIDSGVIDTALRFCPQVSDGAFDDRRVRVVISDGLQFLEQTRDQFDVVIVDSSEPIGPSAVLHTEKFFTLCKRVLRECGILVTQNGLPFLFPDHLSRTTSTLGSLFKSVSPYLCSQPSYFGGPFALNLASDFCITQVTEGELLQRQLHRCIYNLRYWTPAVHSGSFILPRYLSSTLESAFLSGFSAGD